MSFNVALSGISAAQTDLDATSNNIANVNTVGFKESRAEFDSVYANSLFSNSKTKTGDGASVAAVATVTHMCTNLITPYVICRVTKEHSFRVFRVHWS